MPFYMVDRDKRLSVCICKSLCKIHADEERPDKTGISRDGDRVYVAKRYAGVAERVICYFRYYFAMRPACDFGHDSAVARMHFNL